MFASRQGFTKFGGTPVAFSGFGNNGYSPNTAGVRQLETPTNAVLNDYRKNYSFWFYAPTGSVMPISVVLMDDGSGNDFIITLRDDPSALGNISITVEWPLVGTPPNRSLFTYLAPGESAPLYDVWNHVCVSLVGGISRIFFNGTQYRTFLSTGAGPAYNQALTGTLDYPVAPTTLFKSARNFFFNNFTISTTAQTVNFTPPAQPIAATSNIVFYMSGMGPNNSTSFVDSSIYSNPITNSFLTGTDLWYQTTTRANHT